MPSISSSSSSEIPLKPFNAATNAYPAKKAWPPDISSMDTKHQFRLERRFRRRSQIAYLRPAWTRRVKLAQYTAIVGVLVYAALGIDWNSEGDRSAGGPFSSMRRLIGIQGAGVPFDAKSAHRRIEGALGGKRLPPPEEGEGKG